MTFSRLRVCLTVDVEGDCPPFLHTYRGIEEGLAPLLSLLDQEGLRGTFFATGEVGSRYPAVIQEIVSRGHELGSHGLTHSKFTTLGPERAREEIRASAGILRQFAPVQSFRSPHLLFPERYLSFLEEEGFVTDSSQARYKPFHYRRHHPTGIKRVPVSVTSSVLRLPWWLRNPWLGSLSSPVVFFVHSWEFVDWTKEKLRLDCRFRTGTIALDCLRSTIGFFKRRNADFLRIENI